MARYTQNKKGVRSPHFGSLFRKNKVLSAARVCAWYASKQKGTVTGFAIKGNGERSASLHAG